MLTTSFMPEQSSEQKQAMENGKLNTGKDQSQKSLE